MRGRRLAFLKRRAYRIALVIGAAIPVAAWLAAQTDAAGTRLRDAIVDGVESSIKGTIEVQKIAIEPTLAVRAEGVRVIAPDGAVAASASRMRVRLDAQTLWVWRPVLRIEADAPALDLTPDADGKTALTRALEPDVPKTEESQGSRISLSLSLRGASLFRGPPATDPEARPIAAQDVQLAGDLDTYPDGIHALLKGSGWLRSPRDERIALRTELDTRGGTTTLEGVRVVAGRSRAIADAIAIPVGEGGEMGIPEGMIRARLRAVDLSRWAERPIPSNVTLDATSHDGTIVANASLGSGGTVSFVAREDAGTWSGGAIAQDVALPAWGITAVRADGEQGLSAIAGFAARPSDGAWAVHAQTSGFRVRTATIEPVIATARGRGANEVVATISRFAAVEDGRRWALVRPAMVSRDAGRTTVVDLVLAGPRGQSIGVDGTWPPSRNQPLSVVTHALLLEEIPRAFLPAEVRPRGRLDLVARLDAPPRAGDSIPDGKVSLRLRNGQPGLAPPPSWLPAGDLDVVANALLGKRRALVTVDARATTGESLRGTADVPLRIPREDDHAHVDIRAESFHAGRLRKVGARVHGGLRDRRLWLFASAASGNHELVRIGLAGAADVDAIRRERRVPELALWIERFDAAALASAGLLPSGVSGIVRGAAASDGRTITASLAGDGVRYESWVDATVTASARASGSTIVASARLSSEPDSAKAATREASGAAITLGGRAEGAAGAVVRLDPPLARIPFTGVRGWHAAVRGSMQDLRLAKAVARQVPDAMRTQPDADGRLDAALAVDAARGAEPTGWTWLAAKNLVVEGVPAGRVDALAHLRRDRAAAAVTAKGRDGGTLAALASAGPWSDAGILAAPMRAVAAADGFTLASVAGLVREWVTGVEGTLAARIVATGTLGNPVPRGRIELRDGAFKQDEVGRLHEVALTATLKPDEIVIEKLSARGPRGGPVVAKAQATRSRRVPRGAMAALKGPPAGWALTGEARAKNFTVIGQRFAGAFDGNAKVRGNLTQPLLTAKIEVDDATIKLPEVSEKTYQTLEDHPDFVIVSGRNDDVVLVSGREADAAAKPALAVKLHLVAPGTLRVSGRDVDLQLAADVTVDTSKKDGPHLTGEVRALRGNAAVAGKKFVVDQARVGFPGAPVSKAHLDIAADHVVEAAGPDDEETVIHARVTGTVEEPRIAFTSDPAMPEDAVVSMLFLGATSPKSRDAASGESPSLAGRAATLVGNYLTQRLRDEVQKVVPVDVLELETGSPGSTSEGSLRVGKYLAPGLFLSYAHAFGAAEEESVNSVRLEWRLRRRWQVVSEIDDGNRGHVDLVWTREF